MYITGVLMKTYRMLLLVETSRNYGRELLRGIAKYSHIYGPWRFFNELQQERLSISQIRKLAPDGIFAQANDATSIDEFLPKDIPAVMFAGDAGIIPGAPIVIDNWKQEGQIAANHLLEKGFRNFAFCGFDYCHWSKARYEAFSEEIARSGYSVEKYQNPSKRYNQKELSHLCQWIVSLKKPIGLLACNDDRARHVLEACQLCDVHVPEQMAILGIDNDPLRCDMADPPLSSIVINCSAAGFKAAKLMDEMIRTGKKSEELIVAQPTHVNVRRSTDTIAVEDPDVALALQFVRKNARRQVSVEEVADNVAIGRRSLERKFKKALNTTVMRSIRKERVSQICLRLISTNEQISKMAMDFNMCSFTHFADYFKKETGMTPKEYRKKFGSI
jgi:LacI family transcriptional regulator